MTFVEYAFGHLGELFYATMLAIYLPFIAGQLPRSIEGSV